LTLRFVALNIAAGHDLLAVSGMADFRLYVLGSDGRILRPIEMIAEDDDEAIALARDHLNGEPGELWNLSRMVRSFRPGERRLPRQSDPDATAA
jgi:hypothetical protein